MSLLFAFFTVYFPCAAAVSQPLELHIHSQGNDQWSGRLAEPNADQTDGPLATLEAARREIREIKQTKSQRSAPIDVYLHGGDYVLKKAFQLEEKDSGSRTAPITYQGYKGEKVRLLGGRKITGLQPVENNQVLQKLVPEAREHVLQVNLKAQGITDFGHPVEPGKRLELFFNNKPMTLSRWPNEGYTHVEKLVGDQPMKVRNTQGNKVGRLTYKGDRPERWKGDDDIYLHGYWYWDWADAYQKVASIDTELKIIQIEEPYHHYGYREGKRYYALNMLSELDRPGEWYLDRDSGALYFWPPSPVQGADIIISVLDNLVTMNNVDHVTFRELILGFCRSTAITMQDGQQNCVGGSTLCNIGGHAVKIDGGAYNGVIGCDIFQTGNGGISLEGGDRKKLVAGHHYAINNHIHNYSRNSKTYRTAITISGTGCHVAHNLIHHAPHMAILLYGNEHLIEYNEVHTVCMDTDDAGAFYMGRDWSFRGNVLRYNYFHHIGRYEGAAGVQAIYYDDWTSGSKTYGNIIYKVPRGILIGGGRRHLVKNNIFADCGIGVHVDSRGIAWAKNYFEETTTLTDRLEAMPYQQPPWSEKYPELLTLYKDEPALAKYNRIVRNIAWECDKWLDLRYGPTPDLVTHQKNLTNAAPHFEAPADGNFHLLPDSPALQIGFDPIPIDLIGLHKGAFRRTMPEEQ